MTAFSDEELYLRGTETLIASWEMYTRGVPDAAVYRFPGVDVAVFVHEPERGVYNNALLGRGLASQEREAALDALAATYAAAGITRFAAWVHERDAAMRGDLEGRGYRLDASTRAMGMTLADMCLRRPQIEAASLDWGEYIRLFGYPAGLLGRADHRAFHLVVARLGGEPAASAMAFDHGGDSGIFNVATLEHARRRGLGAALVTHQMHDARDRGSQTASLQSTPMAERMYAALGYRDLGRMLEYGP